MKISKAYKNENIDIKPIYKINAPAVLLIDLKM